MQLMPLMSINGRHVNKQKPVQGQGCLYTTDYVGEPQLT